MATPKSGCGWCGEQTSLNCGNCNNVAYCSREHQKSHWKQHKGECKPFTVINSDKGGRLLVASRSLPPGHLIIAEDPVSIGPSASSTPICLACHQPLHGRNYFRCPSCAWPMCSSKCSDSPKHSPECQVLKRDPKRIGVPIHEGETPRYDLILILRCLLFNKLDKASWSKLSAMQSHAEEWKISNEPHHMAAIRYLTEVVKMEEPTDEIHRIRGIIITNSIKTTTTEGVVLRGIYPAISLLNHSCIPNITLRCDKDHRLYIRTTVNVAKGEPLVFSYVPVTDPVWKRQDDLYDIYHFTCTCLRCTKSDELALHYSSPICGQCKSGYVTHGATPESFTGFWTCSDCSNKISLNQIKVDVKESLEWINNKKLQQKHSRLFLKGISEKWHNKHYVYGECLHKVLSFIKGNSSIEAISLKRNIWLEILQLFDVIEPGYTRRRGVSLVEHATSILEQSEKSKDRENRIRDLAEAKKIIEEATTIMSLEPPGTTEQKWIDKASQVVKRINMLS